MSSKKTLIFQSDVRYVPEDRRSDVFFELRNNQIICNGLAYFSASELRLMRLYVLRWKLLVAYIVVILSYALLANLVDFGQSRAVTFVCVALVIVANIFLILLFDAGGFRFTCLMWRFNNGEAIYSMQILEKDLEKSNWNDLATKTVRDALMERFPDSGNDISIRLELKRLGCGVGKLNKEVPGARQLNFLENQKRLNEFYKDVREEFEIFLELILGNILSGIDNPASRDITIHRVKLLKELYASKGNRQIEEHRFSILSDLISDDQSVDTR